MLHSKIGIVNFSRLAYSHRSKFIFSILGHPCEKILTRNETFDIDHFTVKIGHKNTIKAYFFSVSIKYSLCILIQLFFLSTQGLFNRFWLNMKMSLFTSSWGPCSSLKASWCHKGPPLLDWLKQPLFLQACRRQFNHSTQKKNWELPPAVFEFKLRSGKQRW